MEGGRRSSAVGAKGPPRLSHIRRLTAPVLSVIERRKVPVLRYGEQPAVAGNMIYAAAPL